MCRFFVTMINKKVIFGLFIIVYLSGCTSPTAMLGPVYTFTSTGSVFETGLSYGSNKLVKKHTGKTPTENLKEIKFKSEKNIQKRTLESEDFYILVKSKIDKNNKILKKINQ